MKKLNAYMNPIQKWIARWKLRRIIVALETQSDANARVHGFARSLEATEIMSRGLKKDAKCTIEVERADLDAFIRYMTSLHDSKLSRLMLARVGLACLILRDETALKEPAAKILEGEQVRSKASKSEIVNAVGRQLEMKL